MFDGSSEQFHQFIVSSSTTSLPISLPFPLHVTPSFDPYAPPLHHNPPPPPPPPPSKTTENDPWSNDELLSLLKLRSSMEIWFPDFTWEHVSRKLGEIGFKRSAEQCKEKFEEESRNFNSDNNKSYRMMSELDELCHGDDQERGMEKAGEEEPKEAEEEAQQVGKSKESKKRKRKDKFERFKGFCEAVVKKMMAKQEQLHEKLIQDILRRDEEKMAREEAWKNQEAERFRAQIETRSNDHKSAAERQAAIIEFLTHFTSHIDNQHKQQEQEQEEEEEEELNNKSNSNSSSSIPQSQNNNNNNDNNNYEKVHVHPSSPSSIPAASSDPAPPSDDVGKRWPRDEVLALINLRCRMNGEQETSKEKGPLWERISQGMKEMGYKRSAKRCKEKWENINKYFRKTKDSSKKRSVNSRTCPYFHHLSSLYGDGTIVTPTAAAPENAAAAVVELGGERAVDVDGVF